MLLLLLFLLPYLLYFLKYSVRWFTTGSEPVPSPADGLPISIVIAVRNESANVEGLMVQLLALDYPSSGYEIIIVNDYSRDDTRIKFEQYENQFNHFRLIDNFLTPGKKYALQCGIDVARYSTIVTLDADVEFSVCYLQSVAGYFNYYQPDLLIGPVRYKRVKGSLAAWFAQIEMTVLTTIAGAAASLGRPVLCNGANLAFRRTLFLENISLLQQHYPTGDDIFLMLAGKRHGARIIYARSEGAFVSAYPPITIRDLLRQRVRWLSKSGAYADAQLQGLAVATALANISVVVGFGFLVLGYLSYWGFLIPLVLKLGAEYCLYYHGSRFVRVHNQLWEILVFGLIYPLYGSLLILTYFLRVSSRWKD